MTDTAKLPLHELVRAAERELAMRRRVYPKWVADKRMTQADADREIQAMQQIADTLILFQRFEAPVRDCIRRRLADLRTIDRNPAVEEFRAAFPDAEFILHDLPTHNSFDAEGVVEQGEPRESAHDTPQACLRHDPERDQRVRP